MTDQTIIDTSDLKYWRTELPNIIDDLGLDPFQRTLYAHYKKVCGANGGTCEEGIRKTAEKTGMSTAKVSLVRRKLAEKGLITEQEQPKKPDQIKPQVYVMIADIWEINFLYYSYKEGRPNIAGWTVPQVRDWLDSVYHVNAENQRLPDKRERLPDKRKEAGERLPRKQKKEPTAQKEHEGTNDGANAPPGPTARQLKALWNKRSLNSSQITLIAGLAEKYTHEKVIEAATWAHIKGMTFGAALIAIERALPGWGNGKDQTHAHNNPSRVPRGLPEYSVASAADFDDALKRDIDAANGF